MHNTQRLETARLILREFKIEDAEAMYRNWATDPECCKYLSWDVHKSLDETKGVIQKWIDEYKNGSYHWVVELKDTKEIIGDINVIRINPHNTVEVGYCYGSKYWNHGYATEALRAVIEYLLNECNIYLIEARHINENPASGRVMQKAGMVKDGILRERWINHCTGKRTDLTVYSIKKDEL